MSPLRAHFLKSAASKSAFDRAGDVSRELDPAGRSPSFVSELSELQRAVKERRILDIPGEVSDAALAGQREVSKATGMNLPLIGADMAVKKRRRRQAIWRKAFSEHSVPFSEHFLSAGGNFESPEALRAAFLAAGKQIDENSALALSSQMTQMLKAEESNILDRNWSKSAGLVGLDKMRSILASAKKIRSSIGADAADRFTMEHLGSVYSVANRRLRNQARQPVGHALGTVRDSSPSLVAEPAPVAQSFKQELMSFMQKKAEFRPRLCWSCGMGTDPDDTDASHYGRCRCGDKKASLASRLRQARNTTHTHPTAAQARCGNYRHGSLLLHGMHIKIENPKGTERRGYDKDGKQTWTRVMAADYGYFANSKAIDGDAVDCFIGDDLDSHFVVAIDQTKADGSFDESKFVLGTTSQEQAEKLYLAHYPRGWKLGPVSTTTVQQLKEWLKNGNTKAPFKGQMVKAATAVEDTSSSQILTTLLSSLGGALGGSLAGANMGSLASGKQLAALRRVSLQHQRLSTKYNALLNTTSGPGGRNRAAELLVHAGPEMQKIKRLTGKNSKLYGNLVDVVRRREVLGGRAGLATGLALGAVAPSVVKAAPAAVQNLKDRLKDWLKNDNANGQLAKSAKDYGQLLHNLRLRRGECPKCGTPDQPPHPPCSCGQTKSAAGPTSEYFKVENEAFDRAVAQMPEGSDKEMAKKGHGTAVGSCGCRIRGCRCPSKMHNISLTLDIPCEDCATEKSAVVKQDTETGKWVLWTKDEKRKLGTHDNPEDAYKQEYVIQKSQERATPKPGTAASFHKKLKEALGQTEKSAGGRPPSPEPTDMDKLRKLLPRVGKLIMLSCSSGQFKKNGEDESGRPRKAAPEAESR